MREERLYKAIRNIREEYGDLEVSEDTYQGRNSQIYHIKQTAGREFALKIYQANKSEDRMNRLRREVAFLKHLKIKNISCTPKIMLYNEENQWCLMSWIKGKKLESINKNDLNQIARFIGKINQEELINRYPKIEASEGLTNIEEFTNNIFLKAKMIGEIQTEKNRINQCVQKWITQVLFPLIQEAAQEFMAHKNELHWKEAGFGNNISPSDVGVHNTIKSQDELYFFDLQQLQLTPYLQYIFLLIVHCVFYIA